MQNNRRQTRQLGETGLSLAFELRSRMLLFGNDARKVSRGTMVL